MTWIRAAISLVAVLAALAVPGTALAAVEVSYSQSGGLVVNATELALATLSNGEVGGVQEFLVRLTPTGTVTEDTITAGTGCDEGAGARVSCPVTGSRAVTMTLSNLVGGIFDDGLTVLEVQSDAPGFISSLTVDGGAGDDFLQGSKANDTMRGGEGDDQLTSDLGNDVVEGGPGDDSLPASNFDLMVNTFGAVGPNGADVYKGGSGSDSVAYILRNEPVVVTLDGVANDGAAGENDNVGPGNDVETVRGGDRGDTLVGNALANVLDSKEGNDTLRGGSGDDELIGGVGDDNLDGGPGADILRDGGVGNGKDRLDARDGAPDLKIDCGVGLEDTAVIDLFDKPKVIKNCELVTSFAIDDGPPATPRGGRLAIASNGVARAALACPRRAKVRCHGRLSLRDPKRRRHVLASASYTARLGRTARVALALTPGERALLRRRGRALLTTQEQGISRRGPRGAERLLRLAGVAA